MNAELIEEIQKRLPHGAVIMGVTCTVDEPVLYASHINRVYDNCIHTITSKYKYNGRIIIDFTYEASGGTP